MRVLHVNIPTFTFACFIAYTQGELRTILAPSIIIHIQTPLAFFTLEPSLQK
jgi:hypothetical protein